MFNLEQMRLQWQKEREEKIKGKTEREIRIMDLQDQMQSLNREKGKLEGCDCKLCLNRGYSYKMPTDISYNLCVSNCECLKRRKHLRMIEQSGLKEFIESKTFKSFDISKQWQLEFRDFVVNYIKSSGNKCLLLVGQVGCGKSHLCTAAIRYFLYHDRDVLYIPYREEISKMKRLSIDDKYCSDKMESWKSCDILYIDDLFKGIRKDTATGKYNQADVGIMFELIDHRYRNNKKTIISSEYTFDELLEIDGATSSRIFEMCGEWKMQIARDKEKNYRTRDIN